MMGMTHPEPDADEMYCQQCGYELDGDENYCPECGAMVNDNDADDMQNHESVLSYKSRKVLPDSDFAYISPSGKRMFPIPDASHVRNALARLSQANLSAEIKSRIKAKLVKAAKKIGIEVSESVNEPTNLLVENEQSQVQILEGYSDGYARAKFAVTTVDVSNRNGRTYPKSLALREASMAFQGRVLGQSKHPQSEPDLLDQFIVWEKALLENDTEFFIAKIIPTSKGKDFTEIARAGASVSTSRRGTGELREGKDKNGTKTKIVIPESYQIQGVDVLYPGVQSDRGAQHLIHFESIQPESNTEGATNMPESENVVTEEVVSETQAPVTTPEPPVASQSETQSTSSAQAVTTVESGSVTASTPQNAPVPAEIIESLTTQIQAHETQITEQNVKIVNLAKDNATKTEQVKVMTEAISALNNETVRLNKLISEQNTAVNERMKMITDRDALLVKRNQTLAERQKLLVQAHETIAERDNAIGERNRTIAQKNSLVALRDETVSKLQKELSERNTVIAKQDLEIQGRDATIAERDQQIAKERESLAERDAIIAHSDKELVERNAELLTVQQELLNEKVNVELEKNRNAAFQHLFEKVQIEGEKASWFIFNDLRNCATVAEVDEKFAASKVKGIQLIEGVAQVAGRAVLLGTTPTDADEPEVVNPKKPENKSRPALEDDLAKKANSVARYAGL